MRQLLSPRALARLERLTVSVHDGEREVPLSQLVGYVRELRAALGEALDGCRYLVRVARLLTVDKDNPESVEVFSELEDLQRHRALLPEADD